MKKYFYMAVAAVAALSSCSSEDAIFENKNTSSEAPAFVASIENGAETRVTLSTNTPSWEAGDIISIDGHEYTADAAGTTNVKFTGTGATETTHHAFFPASLYNSGTYTLPATYTYEEGKFNMPMYAESTTDNLAFKNLCGVLSITVLPGQMSSVSSIEVSSDKRMNGAFTVTSEGELTFSSAASGEADKKVTITASSAVEIPAAGKTFYVPVPPATHNPLTIKLSHGTKTVVMTTTKTEGVPVARKTLYPIAFADNSNPHFLPGEFSVSATKKVKFTKSNIYWDGSVLHFEAGPTDRPTSWNASHVGHFYWSKTESVSVAASYSDAGRATDDKLWCHEDSKITVDATSDLYALTHDEWKYLISTRPSASSRYKCNITVNGVAGCLIIAPDNANMPTKSSYTLAELDAYGFVCLPPTGQRYGTTFDSANKGIYFPSTPYVDDVANVKRILFTTSLSYENSNLRSYGCSLRLVKTSE